MMKRKTIIIIVVMLLALIVAGKVYAGYLFDHGELLALNGTVPPAGTVNWIAWWRTLGNGTPYEIMTEDSTNCKNGLDIGYSEISVLGGNIELPPDPEPEWILQVENFTSTPIENLDNIYMLFGGLHEYTGQIWKNWSPTNNKLWTWDITEPFTDHGTLQAEVGEACPSLLPYTSTATQFNFYGFPGGTFLIYRSMNASGAGNGASSGKYTYLTKTTTDPTTGLGTFTDTTPGIKWYTVVQADPTTNTPIGCHSETGVSTATEVADFQAAYQFESQSVNLTWTTVNETNIQGFNLYRSEGVNGARIKLNSELIQAVKPGTPDGATYPLTDGAVEVGHSYYYWLEVQRLNGTSFTIKSNEVMLGMRIYIPLISR